MTRLVDLRLTRDRNGIWRGKSADVSGVDVMAIRYCEQCPAWAETLNRHGNGFGYGRCLHREAMNYVDVQGSKAPPAWCPLRKAVAVVMLQEDA